MFVEAYQLEVSIKAYKTIVLQLNLIEILKQHYKKCWPSYEVAMVGFKYYSRSQPPSPKTTHI